MKIRPTITDPKLILLLAEAVKNYEAMTPEQKEAVHDAQRKSWVRAEMDWPRDCPYR